MAFTWTQTIGQYTAKNIAAAINEVRTNTDWLKDNMYYCATNYSTVDTTDKVTHQSTYNATYQGSVNTSVLSSNNSSYYTTYYTSNNSNYNSSVT